MLKAQWWSLGSNTCSSWCKRRNYKNIAWICWIRFSNSMTRWSSRRMGWPWRNWSASRGPQRNLKIVLAGSRWTTSSCRWKSPGNPDVLLSHSSSSRKRSLGLPDAGEVVQLLAVLRSLFFSWEEIKASRPGPALFVLRMLHWLGVHMEKLIDLLECELIDTMEVPEGGHDLHKLRIVA